MENKEKVTMYLNAIYQNTRTAIQSIEDIITKCEDEELKKELAKEQDGYYILAKECEVFAKSENIDNIKDNNWFEKARLWSSINMSTMMDSTCRKIAELMLIGTFMGVLTLIKDKHDHSEVSSELDEITEKLLNFEKENLEKLIPYLNKNE